MWCGFLTRDHGTSPRYNIETLVRITGFLVDMPIQKKRRKSEKIHF